MRAETILAQIDLFTLERQVRLAAQIGQLEAQRTERARVASERIIGRDANAPDTLLTARDYFSQPGANAVAVFDNQALDTLDAQIAEARALFLSGGVTEEEMAVIFESLTMAEDFNCTVRSALNQICVLVGEGIDDIPRVLPLSFPVTEHLLVIEQLARKRTLSQTAQFRPAAVAA